MTPFRRSAPVASIADAGTAALFARVRALRIADGPDEVHARTIALLEQKRYRSA